MTDTGVIDAQIRARLSAVLPDAGVDAVLHHTGKTLVLAAKIGERRAVVKVLADPDPFWTAKFQAELDTYQAFETAPPPVPVPRLLAVDPDMGVLAITRLPGTPIHPDRYPAKLGDDAVRLLVDTAVRMQSWHVPAALFTPVWDYPARYTRYQGLGLLDQDDVTALTALTTIAGPPTRMAHGDLLPANVLYQPAVDGRPAAVTGVLDFEFTGRFLLCLDLALLWVLLGGVPHARRLVTAAIGADPQERAGFWINVAMVCTRELRTHGELPPDHRLRARLPHLTASWAQARKRLHDTAGRL
jgi:aminoglycoside phosphotransferase (APT) family kinase protein